MRPRRLAFVSLAILSLAAPLGCGGSKEDDSEVFIDTGSETDTEVGTDVDTGSDTGSDTPSDTADTDSDSGSDSDADSDTGSDTGSDSDTGSETADSDTPSDSDSTSDSDTGSDSASESDSASDSDSETDDGSCDLSGWSVVEDLGGNLRCLTLPDTLVLEPGATLVITTNAAPSRYETCYGPLPVTAVDTGFAAGSTWYTVGAMQLLVGGASTFGLSGQFPLVGTPLAITLRDGACDGGSGYNGSGLVDGTGTIVDGPSFPMPAMADPNMTRALPVADGTLEASWTATASGATNFLVRSPYGGANDAAGPRLTELNDYSMSVDADCDYIEITCPGGPALTFCEATAALECEPLESCLHSIPGIDAVPQAALDCATNALDCQTFNTDCWGEIIFN